MTVDDDALWKALRQRAAADDSEPPEAEQLAAAERLLAGIDDAPPLDAARIEAIVRAATADEPETAPGPRPSPLTVVPSAPRRRSGSQWLAAAAAVLFAPKLLAATAVATVVVASALWLSHTVTNLSFQAAVRALADERLDDGNRMAAQGRVALDVLETLHLLVELEEQPLDPTVAAARRASLQRVRDQLRTVAPPLPMPTSVSLLALGDRANDPSGPIEPRLEAVRLLGELSTVGIATLQQVGARAGDGDLRTKNRAYLMQIETALP
jgi:hypothetical protein